MKARSRATVCSIIVVFPTMFSNCLGVRVLLRGQKRVPRPPARITAWMLSFGFDMGANRLRLEILLFYQILDSLIDDAAKEGPELSLTAGMSAPSAVASSSAM